MRDVLCLDRARRARLWGVVVLTASIAWSCVSAPPIELGASVYATHGMVVAAHPEAARAGLEVLQAGGNAVDAAVAAAFALGVAEPDASGLGGGGFLLIYLAESRRLVAIDYRERAPFSATSEMYALGGPGLPGLWNAPGTAVEQKALMTTGGGSVAVPTMLRGMELALELAGTLPLCAVLAPAIELAESGFTVSRSLYTNVLNNYGELLDNDDLGSIFLRDGLPVEVGERMTRPALASTLRRIAAEGVDLFYRGELAERILETVAAAGGGLKPCDLAEANARVVTPLIMPYRDLEIAVLPPPAGGATLLQGLRILETMDVPDPLWASADAVHYVAEALKGAMADRDTYLGDPEFVDVPVPALFSADAAQMARDRIDPAQATAFPAPLAVESSGTTHISVVDAEGNCVALTQSLNLFLGAKLAVPGTGILLNNTMGDFVADPGWPNSPDATKAPLSSMSPTIVLRDGAPVLVIGTPGGRRIATVLALVLTPWSMGGDALLETVVEAPRFYAEQQTLYVEGRIPREVLADLAARGHLIVDQGDYSTFFGGIHAIEIARPDGAVLLHGVADSRRSGAAAGY